MLVLRKWHVSQLAQLHEASNWRRYTVTGVTGADMQGGKEHLRICARKYSYNKTSQLLKL